MGDVRMLQNRVTLQMPGMNVKPGKGLNRQAQLQHLQNEIDKLALLVNEAKRQSDRIQAAADALGDAVLLKLEGIRPASNGEKRNRMRKIDG